MITDDDRKAAEEFIKEQYLPGAVIKTPTPAALEIGFLVGMFQGYGGRQLKSTN